MEVAMRWRKAAAAAVAPTAHTVDKDVSKLLRI